jgi:hypothetical protein
VIRVGNLPHARDIIARPVGAGHFPDAVFPYPGSATRM